MKTEKILRCTSAVAVLSSEHFDATSVDPTSMTLAGAGVKIKQNGKPQAASEDVNSDGLPDLVAHFVTNDLQIEESNAQTILIGFTVDGAIVFRGIDGIRIVP